MRTMAGERMTGLSPGVEFFSPVDMECPECGPWRSGLWESCQQGVSKKSGLFPPVRGRQTPDKQIEDVRCARCYKYRARQGRARWVSRLT